MRYLPFLSKIFIIYDCEVTDVRFMLLRALEKNAVPILLNDRKMNFNDLTFVRSGEMSYIINEKSFTVKAGEAMYCPTGARRYRFKGTQSADYFSVNFKCAPEEKLDLPYHIKDALTPEIEEYFKNIMKLVDRTGEYDKFKCDAYTSLIAYATLERKPESIENRYLTGMKSYISENWNKKISIENVTSAAGLSRSYGAAFFKEHTGETLASYYKRRKIEIAKQLREGKRAEGVRESGGQGDMRGEEGFPPHESFVRSELIQLGEELLAVLQLDHCGRLDGVVLIIKGVGARDTLCAINCGQSINDSLLELIGAGGEASLIGDSQSVAHQHGGVIGEGGKHIGDRLAVSCLVIGLELGDRLSAGCVARAVDGAFQILGAGVILDTAEAVAAQDGGGQTGLTALGDGQTGLTVVDGHEDHVGVGAGDLGHLGVEVLVAGGESLGGDNFQTQSISLGHESVLQTLGVVAAALIQDSGGLGAQLVKGVVSHLLALEGVDEAGTEHVGAHRTIFHHSQAGRGGGSADLGHVDLVGGVSQGDGGAGQHGADDGGDALVHGQIEGVHGLHAVALVIILQHDDLLAVDAALGVELVNVQLGAVAHGDTILGIVTGGVADESDGNALAALALAAAAAAAADQQTQTHDTSKSQRYDLFHFILPPGFPSAAVAADPKLWKSFRFVFIIGF